MMTVHVLHAGDGYTYLTDSVATHDVAREPGSELADYYTAEGNTPGRWRGSGLVGVGVSGEVSEAQMRALFGEGLHPEADAMIAEAMAGGLGAEDAVRSARLGRKYPQHSTEREDRWRETLAAEVAATARKLGVDERQLAPAQRDAARLRAGGKLFHRLRGRAPVDERELRQFTARQAKPTAQAVAGFDLVFTPVKSVSVLWALADHDTRRTIEAAHEAAVTRAVGFLESEAAFTRTGEAGVAQENTRGLIIAAFDHRDSRGGDPNLHTHCAVSNKVQGTDGKWRSLDGTAIHQMGVAASETYNTAIEDELRNRLGVDFTAVERRDGKRPVREIVGVDERLITGFSSRRDAITGRYEELLADYRARHGKSVPKGVQYQLAQQATLDTRAGKTEVKSLAEQRHEWHKRAVEMIGEIGVASLGSAVSGHGITTGRAGGDVDIAAEADAVIDALSVERCRWRVTHVRAEAQRHLRDVTVSDQGEREALVEAVTESALARSITISAPEFEETPAELTRADGVSVFRKHGADWLTSAAVMAAEDRLLEAAETHAETRLDEAVFDAIVASWEDDRGRELDAGQRALARQFACSTRQVAVGVGPAGAGKTTAMAALAHTIQAGGHRVVAVAPSASAATLLGQEIGADSSDTLAATLLRAKNPDRGDMGFDAGDVIVVDEASMASTFDLDDLVQIAAGRGARVRLLGDHMQLTSVEAGGAFRLLAETTGAVELAEVHRFTLEAEADATQSLRVGDETALDFYEAHERIHSGQAGELADRVYGAWKDDQEAGLQSLMVASQSTTVNELNARARIDRVTAGLVDSNGIQLMNGATVGAGDVIVTRRNERSLTAGASGFVKNGDLWHIEEAHDDGSLTVTHQHHRGQVLLPSHYVSAHVELGYATTIHRAQGMTVDACHTLVDESMNRQGLYVALTRGRESNHAYVPTDITVDVDMHTPPEPVEPTSREVLAGILARDGADVSAHQTIADELEAAESLATLIPEYEHALDVRGESEMSAVVREVFEPTQLTAGRERRASDPRLLATVQAAWEYFDSCRQDSWVPAHLHERGLTNMDRFGYAPDGWTNLVDHLRAAGFGDEDIIDAGLAKRSARGRVYDRFRDRLIHPIHDADGVLVAFMGRANPQAADPKTPKYMNSPSSDLYDKSSVLIGLAENHEALAAGAMPVIAEGPLDAEAITQATGGAAVGLAPGGTALTSDHVAALAAICDLTTTPVVVATDNDEAGQAAAEAAWHKLTDAGATHVRAADFGAAASDPAELLQHRGQDALAEAVSNTQPLVDTVIDRRITTWSHVLDHINGRFGALDDIAAIVARLPDEQQPAAMIPAASRLDIDGGAAAERLAEATATRQQNYASHLGEHASGSRAETILNDPAWPGLSRRLSRLQAAGHDPTVALQQATDASDFTAAHSITRVLASRLDNQHQPSALIPVAPAAPADDDQLGSWLTQRHQRIQHRVETLSADLRENPPEWVRANYAPGDNPTHLATLTQVAIYRDRYQVTDTDHPLGYEPDHPGAQQDQWRHLKARVAQLPHSTDPQAGDQHQDDIAAKLRAIAATRPSGKPSRPKPQQQHPRPHDPGRGHDLDR